MCMKRCWLFLMPLFLYGCMLSDHHTTVDIKSYFKDTIGTPSFFPASFSKAYIDTLNYDDMSKMLQAFHEKPLQEYANGSPVVRFYYSGWFRAPVIIRIDNKQVVVKKVNFLQPGFETHYDSKMKQEVPDADHFIYQQTTFTNQPDKFSALMNYADTTVFWETSGLTPSGGSADGVDWNVEIIQNGKYNHIQVWSPDHGSFYNLCLQILHYAKLEEDFR
jgi:hypothetical protein